MTANCLFRLDSSSFDFQVKGKFITPPSTYHDDNKLLAVSDIESGYRAFRDFLINNQVIDQELNWTFGKGHLVLVGDFVDRGFSTTQVLWFIFKLEQEAEKHGGQVHFILGNHELKNMQGNYKSASPKYHHVAAILGKQQHDLYNMNSVIGRWMASKNTLELINGHLFVHGGIHPDIADSKYTIQEMNELVRKHYHQSYFPSKTDQDNRLFISTRTGPSWYRGYFKADLSQEEVDKGLAKFNAKDVIVGHTIQTKVNRTYEGKVIGIDVKHPKDYQKNWPSGSSEGLLIEGENYYRVLATGERIEL